MWLDNRTAEAFEKKVKQAVSRCYYACEMKVAFNYRRIFPFVVKDRIPTQEMSNVIYKLTCRCDCPYVGETTQHLESRMKQHVPSLTAKSSTLSAIGEHLLANEECAKAYKPEQFTIIHRARNKSILDILEAIYIKTIKPELCKQMQFVKSLNLFRA